MRSEAETVEEYLQELPADRRNSISQVRDIILANLPDQYEETMQYGMISYVIPLERYPKTYNKLPLAYISLASQKNYMALYLNHVYSNPAIEEWFTKEYKATGKKLDMGKSCVRFKKLKDLPLDLIGEVVAKEPVDKYIERYEIAKSK